MLVTSLKHLKQKMNDSEFFVTVMSNACTDEFNQNTLSSFSNKLPQNLELSNLNEWYVSLHSLGVSSKFRNIETPKNKNLPNFKLILRLHDSSKRSNILSCSTLGPKLVKLGLHSQFNRSKYTTAFIQSLESQPVEFMKMLSYDTDVFGGDYEDIIRKHASLAKIVSWDTTLKTTGDNGEHPSFSNSEKIYNKKKVFTVETDHIDAYFKDEYLSIDDIRDSFKNWRRLDIPLDVCIEEGEYFSIKAVESRLFECYCFTLMIHSSSVKTFCLKPETLRKTVYDNEVYYCKDFNNRHDFLIGQSKNWYYNYPQVICVECDQVKEQIHNSELEKHTSVICPEFNKKEVYYNFLSEIRHFHPVRNNYLNALTIRLKDLDGNLLDLQPGPATYVKLLFKKMEPSSSFNIRLSEKNSSFETKLPQPVNLDQRWKVSLSSISFPTEFLPLPFDREKRKIFYTAGNNINATTLPNIQYTKSLLVRLLSQFFDKGGIKIAVVNDRLNITCGKETLVGFSKPIAHILGFDEDINSDKYPSPDFKYKHVQDYVLVTAKAAAHQKSFFHGTMNMDYLMPCYLMVYANIIDHCIVGAQYIKLLRIVPINKFTGNNYDLHEFPQAEYHGLEYTYFDSIKIEIRDHSGELVNFIDKKLSLNFHFSCEKM